MIFDIMFLSIIIPVYNADKYIRACVDSLGGLPAYLSISNAEMEVILVDDGSKDESGRVCDELSLHDYSFNVKVLHQDNQGVSIARNEGLKISTGEWIWFIDADDYIELPSEKNIPVLFGEENFVVTGFVWEENGKSIVYGASADEIPYNLWRCWFKREQIMNHGIHFVHGRKYAEDQEFILKYLVGLGKTMSLPLAEIHYHYTMRPGSAMTRSGIKGKQTKDLLSVLFSLLFNGTKMGVWRKKWFWKDIKRMTKTLIVVLSR